jgi:hypothetical protein
VLPHELDRVPDAVRTAAESADGGLVVFVYDGEARPTRIIPGLLEIVDPYLEDPQAQAVLSRAAAEARRAGISDRYVYLPNNPDPAALDWLVRTLRSGKPPPLGEEVTAT